MAAKALGWERFDMVIWVKTTIDIADVLLVDAKERAHQRGTTLRALVEEGLRTVLDRPPEGDGYRWEPVVWGDPNEPLPQAEIEKALREARMGRRFPEFGDPPDGSDL
jgi:hypothetical protein